MSNLGCPVHMLTNLPCCSACAVARLEYEKSARDLAVYWRTWEARDKRLRAWQKRLMDDDGAPAA